MPCVRTSRSITVASPEVGGKKAEQDLDERALAGAVGSDQADDPGFELEGEAVERGHAARVALGQVPKAMRGIAREA